MELNTLLDHASSGIDAPPDLLQRVRAGGSHRLRRRRMASGATAVVLIASVAVGAVGVSRRTDPNSATVTFAGEIFDGATHGDLSGDASYLSAVVQAWNDSHGSSLNADRGIFDDLRGKPRVLWAGTTPAGPAAVVAQDAYLHHHGNISLNREGIYQLLGFVGPGRDGRPVVVADTYPAPGVSSDIAWFVDTDRHVVAAIDTGKPMGLSTGWVYADDGRVTRTYVPMNTHDGVAWQQLPAGTVPGLSVHIGLLPVTGPDDVRGVINAEFSNRLPDTRLPWQTPGEDATLFRLGGSWEPTTNELRSRLDSAIHARRTGGQAFSEGFSLWLAYGTTPDGRQLVVGENVLEADPSHVYAVLGEGATQKVVSAPSNLRGPLGVALHLPDGQGWMVAQYREAIDYRIGSGPWVAAGRDAALLPEQATQVRVNDAVVPLLSH
jgi:hypothetical protein